ncbi:SRPBCC domain-containing protein [Phenylobacterium sp.]|uniref:SRPBCC family protein n=1 Tax=Phenylobacterium sp. TaxID=1871053 RepID=UPI0025FC20BA|nr:SRPBCC domain-containing protein [Phenylobacterium sp.]MBX3482662.1 SRPBCC domain-containing protein [Phenylobacterium sp.]MCW5760196.1 SRPBCC domain-containing protein [Phenylobacterium sp.]
MSKPMPVLKRSLEIDAPPGEVWRVLTNPELVREWASAYLDGISIRTSWREGDKITWKAPDGVTRSCGTVAAFKPERLLRLDYPDDPRGPFSDIFEIAANGNDRTTRLEFTTGPLAEVDLAALEGPTDEAIREIKSLAEESAQIHGVR